MTGYLTLLTAQEHYSLYTPDGWVHLRRGDTLEMQLDGRWYRGRVEFNDRLDWYWTDDRRNYRMLPGDVARVWDGRTWPPPERHHQGGIAHG
jgi:hypothetical protein